MPSAVKTLVIGSRGSHLALWQANYTAQLLGKAGVSTRVEIIKTTGDHLQTASLVQAGGKGLFTKEIEDALLAGSIDLAVHSLKDLPTETPVGLTIAAVPEREDPRDAIVGSKLGELPDGARVGTSSGRRAAQLKALRPDLAIGPVRGNVDTRLRKLHNGEYDAILLAAAGLRRLGFDDQIAEVFSAEQMCPAAGQGALAVETRERDEAFEICRTLNHEASCRAVAAERAALRELGGGCQLPVGAYAYCAGAELVLSAAVISPDGSRVLRFSGSGAVDEPAALGVRAARDLLARGAGEILGAIS